jgi:hypothetical protein
MQLPPEAAWQHGRFSYSQARAAGITRRRLARALRRGELVEVGHGVFATTRPTKDLRADVVAAQLAGRRSWCAARRTAALIFGLPLIGCAPDVPQLLRDGAGTRARGRDRHARVGRLPAEQCWEYDGIALTSPARTVVDIARGEPFRNGVVTADAVLRRGVDRDELKAVLRGMFRWPGVETARRVVAFADGRAESPGESLVRVAFLREELPVPEPQVEVWRYGELVGRVDLLVRESLLVVESDGALKFTGPGVLPALIEREQRLRDCGLEVVRTGWDETFKDTSAFGRRVRDRLRTVRRLAPGVELRSTALRVQGPSLALPPPPRPR